MRQLTFFLPMFLLIFATRLTAQEASPEPITATNMQRLQSVAQVDYSSIESEFDVGSFWIDETGDRIAFFDAFGTMFVADSNGQIISRDSRFASDTRQPGSVVGVVFNGNEPMPLMQQSGVAYLNDLPIEIDGVAVAVWQSDEAIYAETINRDGETIINLLPLDDLRASEELAYLPAADEDAVVRVGRIRPPRAVTSDATGVVKLWSLAPVPQLLHEVDNGTGQPSVFGNINPDATHLVWRDNPNEALYLLDFEVGENRFIDNLNGAYAQWFFLSNDASIILAVNLDFEPVVVAWDAATGDRTVLGEHRTCGRPQPDMARLSADGTTLLIGCDTGLDIWRIAGE